MSALVITKLLASVFFFLSSGHIVLAEGRTHVHSATSTPVEHQERSGSSMIIDEGGNIGQEELQAKEKDKVLVKNATATSNNQNLSLQSSRTATRECGVYLAPSTIPGAGLGMFAGNRNYNKGDDVTFGDVVIPIVEREWNTDDLPENITKTFLWDEYTWSGDVFPGMEEENDDVADISAASPGMGAAINCFIGLNNVDDVKTSMSRGGMSPSSPGLGAISPYYGRKFFATETIPAGMEFFASYGENYFKSRAYKYGYVPLRRNYIQADRLIKVYLTKRDTWRRRTMMMMDSTSTNGDDANDTDEKSKKGEAIWDDLWTVIHSQASIWKTSRTFNALPEHYSTIEDTIRSGGTSKQHHERSIRDVSWLEEHGQCMDNIKSDQSTIPEAGRGAFANRDITRGGLVSPGPLIHIDEASLAMFKPKTIHSDKTSKSQDVPNMDGPMTYQLLMNYCFGHMESSLLLCPYGLLTGYINHSHDNPNTKIVWSKEMRHPEWKDQPNDKWQNVFHNGLSLDYVALRDIAEDEEILIDYGEGWEQAWQEHVQTFVPSKPNYIPAYELNKVNKDDVVYRTLEDDDYRPYEDDGVELHCMSKPLSNDGGKSDQRRFTNRYSYKTGRCKILKMLVDNEKEIDQAKLYEVEFLVDKGKTNQEHGEIRNVTSDAFRFVDMPYTRDHHMFNSFRHPMLIPDDMFPEVWRNKKEKKAPSTSFCRRIESPSTPQP